MLIKSINSLFKSSSLYIYNNLHSAYDEDLFKKSCEQISDELSLISVELEHTNFTDVMTLNIVRKRILKLEPIKIKSIFPFSNTEKGPRLAKNLLLDILESFDKKYVRGIQ